jgi:hypothetical protein
MYLVRDATDKRSSIWSRSFPMKDDGCRGLVTDAFSGNEEKVSITPKVSPFLPTTASFTTEICF